MASNTTRMAFSSNRFPLNSAYQAGLLFGGCVQPFSFSSTNRPIQLHRQQQQDSNIGLRCFNCGGYWWPSCSWRGKDSWICALCGEESVLEHRPKAEELRDLTVLYEEEAATGNNGGGVCFFFVIDGTSEDAFVDAALLAIMSVVQSSVALELPSTLQFGLAVSMHDSLSVVEFPVSVETDDSCASSFVVTTLRVNGRRFRVDLKECSSPRLASCTDRDVFVRALSSCKSIIRSHSITSTSSTTSPVTANVFGRACVHVLDFLSLCAGAHVFAFSEHCAFPPSSAAACQEAVGEYRQRNVNGLDFITVTGSGSADGVDSAMLNLVRGSGGHLACHVFQDLKQSVLHSLVRRFQLGFVLRGMVRARTCPELTVALPRRTAAATAASPATGTGTGAGGEWWLVGALKRLLETVVQHPAQQLLPAVAAAPSSSPSRTTNSCFFLGPGHALVTEASGGLWIVPSCAQNETLGFELDFADPIMGMESFSYPRAMAVQIASTFVTLDGRRFTRIETKACESADTPSRSAQETWKWCDYPVLAYLLCRLLCFSFDAGDYVDVVLDWTARALANRGLPLDKFERSKLARALFGWLKAPECGQSVRAAQSHGAGGLAGRLGVVDLERYLWPVLVRCDLPHNPLQLSLAVLKGGHSFVLDCVSHVFLVLGDGVDAQEAGRAQERAHSMVSCHCISGGVTVLHMRDVLSNSNNMNMNMNSNNSNMNSPFAASAQEAAKDLFLSLMYEDGPEFAAFVANCVERSRIVELGL